MTGQAPDVSVLVCTYNHAPYIEQALRSVLAQVTRRTIEVIVSEDASTDATRAIVERIAGEDERVHPLLSERNLRSNEVVARAIRRAQGKYLCLLDGDDYWTSPARIEQQADLLDAAPDCSAVFHNALVISETGPTDRRWTPATQPRRIGLADLWHGNPFATSAGMMRTGLLHELGDWYAGFFPITDWPLYILCASHGEVVFVDEVVAAYRLHGGGLFSALPGRAKLDLTARFYRRMDAALGFRMHELARAGGSRYFFDWAKAYMKRGEGSLARTCLWHSLRSGGVGLSVGRRDWARMALRLCTGRTH
jgi:glycosyltransferase involved in cell wall biosynthesis